MGVVHSELHFNVGFTFNWHGHNGKEKVSILHLPFDLLLSGQASNQPAERCDGLPDFGGKRRDGKVQFFVVGTKC